ncbi:MAG TPA: TetR/AcrR family transcriptional regulator [Solirubrobacteraceae bacterium]
MTEDGENPEAGDRYKRLPAGLHGIAAEVVARDQRERLCEAMAELVAQRGYTAVRVSDLTALAGVSRPTFYELYQDKEDCLLAAYDEIAARVTEMLAAAEREAPPGEGLHTALEAFADIAGSHPDQVSLLVLGALGAGPDARVRREQTLRALNRRILRLQDSSPSGSQSSQRTRGSTRMRAGEQLTMTILLGGIREVIATRLRGGDGTGLSLLPAELSAWASSYPLTPPKGIEAPTSAAERRSALALGSAPSFPRTATPGERLPSGRHDLSARFVALNQRERILDAVAEATAADGYTGLAIPAIARRAHISHQTFYEHFPSKQDAFLAAMRVGIAGALRTSSEAFSATDGSWPEAVARAVHTFLRALAVEPAYARLGMVEAMAAGPAALDLRDEAMRNFAAFLQPGYQLAEEAGLEPPAIAAEAVVGGAWQTVHLEVAAGRERELPLLAPLLIYTALTPFLGAKDAARHARRKPR